MYTLQDFHRNLNFAISFVANSQNLNSTDDLSFRNVQLTAYRFEIQNAKFANMKFHEFD